MRNGWFAVTFSIKICAEHFLRKNIFIFSFFWTEKNILEKDREKGKQMNDSL
jgi:hypothetical protein